MVSLPLKALICLLVFKHTDSIWYVIHLQGPSLWSSPRSPSNTATRNERGSAGANCPVQRSGQGPNSSLLLLQRGSSVLLPLPGHTGSYRFHSHTLTVTWATVGALYSTHVQLSGPCFHSYLISFSFWSRILACCGLFKMIVWFFIFLSPLSSSNHIIWDELWLVSNSVYSDAAQHLPGVHCNHLSMAEAGFMPGTARATLKVPGGLGTVSVQVPHAPLTCT